LVSYEVEKWRKGMAGMVKRWKKLGVRCCLKEKKQQKNNGGRYPYNASSGCGF